AELEGKIRELQENIRQRKEAEDALALQTKELLRSNADLERFAYIASHDLQEPLRTVMSYVQLLEQRYKDKLDAQATEFIAYAVDGVNWMQALINGLLTYSRVGTQAEEFRSVDCNATIKRVLRNLQVMIKENNAEVTSDLLPVINADNSQIELLFQNLVGNGIKFHTEQQPRVHISVEDKFTEWVFCVSDNGIGIPPQSAERIFEMFQRLHTRKKYPGTGIGLAVCKKIVERHGGAIWVKSEMGEGAKFYFTIPKKMR
ncbi:MAG: ATP-binding protein, partial [Candidatus Omnitrophica bacterium]|nr:ATP-binding protein [Candidatus Omnitrophota bacterium]